MVLGDAETMLKFVESKGPVRKRSLVSGYKTAYPRRQDDCPNPEEGLASVEALYLAYLTLGRNPEGLLDFYYWKDEFLNKIKSC